MKTIGALLSYLSAPMRERRVRVLAWLLVAFAAMIALYSVIFHEIMAREGQDHSWASGVYWTLVTMSTLGFGDITFESDAGRVFSVVVLVTGVSFILVLLPFSFVQFVFMPWMDRREAARAPRKLRADVSDHVVLTQLDVITDAFIRRADRMDVPYVLVTPELTDALRLHDQGYRVMVGELDDPTTYRAARVDRAALVATTRTDRANTNIAFTVREIDGDVPVVTTASAAASVDILELAGCDRILQLGEMLGRAVAQRVLGRDARSHVVGEFDKLLVAEANVAGTSLAGQTLASADLRRRFRVNVVGVWQRGDFQLPRPDTVFDDSDVLILVGDAAQLATYDAAFSSERGMDAPAVIIGGGRVGRAAGRTLAAAGVGSTIVEQREERIRDPERYVLGDAAEREVLERAGLSEAGAVLITTHDDDVNVYLTLYCRRLRPDIQIISRANVDRNVSTLHRAGADAVLSYASIGATAIWNTLELGDTLVLAEGLEMFRTSMPTAIAGRTLADAAIRTRTGCNVVATVRDGRIDTNPDAHTPLPADADLIVIGDSTSEAAFLSCFPVRRRAPGTRLGRTLRRRISAR